MDTSSNYLLLLLLLLFLSPTFIIYSAASPPSQNADRIIQAMIGAGDFRDWAADFISSVDTQFGIPLSATIFIPADFDAAALDSSSSAANSSRLSVAYHIVPQRLSFSVLCLLQPLSRLPTLLPGNSIVVTNNSVSDYTLDGVLVSEPDLFVSSSIAIHGVASPFDFSLYGDFGNGGYNGLADWSQRRRCRGGGGCDANQTSASGSVVYFSKGLFLLPLSLALFLILTLHSGDVY
ncbi:unnamed protein product [Cochlearia groenlandica]